MRPHVPPRVVTASRLGNSEMGQSEEGPYLTAQLEVLGVHSNLSSRLLFLWQVAGQEDEDIIAELVCKCFQVTADIAVKHTVLKQQQAILY